jgi:hypothetical protein
MTYTSSTVRVPDVGAVPRHIAIIMDGNGRWATERRLPRVAGHTAAWTPCGRWSQAVRAPASIPDAVRVQFGELAAPEGRGVVPDAAVHQPRSNARSASCMRTASACGWSAISIASSRASAT